MFGRLVTVRLEVGRVLAPVESVVKSPDYIDALEAAGYSDISLVGVKRFKPYLMSGYRLGDELRIGVDPDAFFLMSYYLELERWVSEGREGKCVTYLEDGIFVVAAHVGKESVRVLMGHLRGDPTEPSWKDAVEMPVDDYLSMWRSVAAAIVAAVAEGPAASGRRP